MNLDWRRGRAFRLESRAALRYGKPSGHLWMRAVRTSSFVVADQGFLMRRSLPLCLWGGTALWLVGATLFAADEPATGGPLEAARRQLQEGKYAEAEEAYRAILKTHGAPAALGLARTQAATGHRQQAAGTLSAASKEHPDAAALPAELARLALDRGDHDAATQLADAALKLESDTALA
jgi:hypothetical protein